MPKAIWQGIVLAESYDVVVNGRVNKDAARCYPAPKTDARKIEGCVAVWRGVQVVP